MARSGDRRQRRQRGSISADDIVSGAIDVARQVSVDHLSMPLLAKHLDVGVTSIYWYFRAKDDLLNAMTDRILAEYDFAVPLIDAANWRASLYEHALRMRQKFLADPLACDLILLRGAYSKRAAHLALARIERPVTALVTAGLSAQDAVSIYSGIAMHVRGTVIMTRLQDKMPPPAGRGGDELALVDTASMPLLAGVVSQGHRIAEANDSNFEFVLNCLLDFADALIGKPQSRSAS
jgi:AcrR family transcriptional regulator